MERVCGESIEVLGDGAVRTIAFGSDHRLNPMTRWMVGGLRDAFESIDFDEVRVVALWGKPVFGCGAHLGELSELTSDELGAFVSDELALAAVVEQAPCLTVAIVEGVCLGNAAELALACDMRIAEHGTKLGWPEIKAGFAAPADQLLRYLRPGVASSMLLTGDLIDASHALSLGLLTKVIDRGLLAADSQRLLSEWSALPVEGIRATKRSLSSDRD